LQAVVAGTDPGGYPTEEPQARLADLRAHLDDSEA
jgi:hypothetical protein